MTDKQEILDGSGVEAIERQATLLFVDDESNILSSLRRLFRSPNYKILLAESGAEGLKLFEQEDIDLVVSDMRMPEMDGAQFLEQVSNKWPDTLRILLTGFADMKSTIDAVNKGGIYKYISKPWDDDELKLSVKSALDHRFLEQENKRLMELTRKQYEELKDLNENLENKVKARTSEVEQMMGMYEAANESLKESYVKSVEVFSNVTEMREGINIGLSRRLAERAYKMAKVLGMNDDDAEQLRYAALLHDIGKVSLPDDLLSKPYSTLGPNEKIVFEKHPVIGESLLMSVEQLYQAANIILCQHERYDGKGYPNRLSGDSIPLGASILSILNDFDALQLGKITDQNYSSSEAIKFIRDAAGIRYPQDVVDVFMSLIDQLATHAVLEAARRLRSENLGVGMVLARDLQTEEGVLLLSKGYVLDENIISKIRKFEQSLQEELNIYVCKPGE